MNETTQSSASEEDGQHQNTRTFHVGGIEFTAFRVPDPRMPNRQWWALRVVENDNVYDPRDGCSHDHSSVPKLQASIEDVFVRDYENDPDLLRRGYGLPPRLERIRDLAKRVGVWAEANDEHQTWSSFYDGGGREHGFESEAAALLAGIRKCEAMEEFRNAVKSYIWDDDTFLVVRASHMVRPSTGRGEENNDDCEPRGMKP